MHNQHDADLAALRARLQGGPAVDRVLAEVRGPGRPEREWWSAAAAEFDAGELTLPEARALVAELAWAQRLRGDAIPAIGADLDGSTARFALYEVTQRHRFDFRFASVTRVLRDRPGQVAGDALLAAMAAFAELGSGDDRGLSSLEDAWARPDADRRCRFILLAGLWSAHHLPEQGALLLARCDEVFERGEGDLNVHFRRAAAYRKLGRLREALRDVDAALELLPPGQNDVNQDYLRERELIGLAVTWSRDDSQKVRHG